MPTYFKIIKTDFVRSWKVIVVWSISISLLALFTISLFDVVKQQSAQLEIILSNFPPELLKAFGSDAKTITSFTGYFNTKFLSLFLIINTVLASYLGAVSLGKEIKTGTILPLISRPLKRGTIYLAKFSAIILSLLVSNLIVGLISYFATATLTTEQIGIQFFWISFGGAFLFECLFAAFGMMIGQVISDNQTLMIGGGLVIAFMIIDAVSILKGVPEVIKYLTPYYYLSLNHIAEYRELRAEILYLVLATIVITIIGVNLFKRRNIAI